MPLICVLNAHLFWNYFDSKEAKAHATSSDPWASNWVQTHGGSFGPYEITSWEPGKQVVMEANENYWKGSPKIKKIIWQVVPDAAGRLALLQAGKVDIADSLSAEQVSALAGKSGIRVAGQRSPQALFIVMNNATPPFTNAKVRQAINTAIPRSAIVKDVYHGLAYEWQGPTPSVYSGTGYLARQQYDYNLAKAKRLLTQAGYANGFSVTLSYNAGDPVQEQIAILLRDSLSKIGINVSLQKLPTAAIQDLIFSGNDPKTAKGATFALWLDAAFFPETQVVSQLLFYPGLGDFQNYGQTHPAYVKRIDAGSPIVGATKRLAYFGPVQSTLYRDASLGWIAEPYFLGALSSRVAGYGLDCFPFYEVYRMSLT
jgi:peptide/nickel transport system substrate-binding protein